MGVDYLGLPLRESPGADTSSWTDYLPICNSTGVGFLPNQIYRRDGHRYNEHEPEDQSFHFRLQDNTYLYGVFDGHSGPQAAEFAVQKMPAEILLDQQLLEYRTDEEIREVLRQAFLSVDREFFTVKMGDQLAQRTALISEVPEGSNQYETFKDYPQMLTSLESLNRAVASGTTAVVVLIINGKLFVSNVGDSRALLCRTDEDGVLRVVQLSVDHDLHNEDELFRLQQLNLDVAKIRQFARIGNQFNTRCLGNYLVKGGYKEIDLLSSATSEPVIPDPEIHKGVLLDDSCRFLVLLSDGLYKSLMEASESDQVNIQLAQMLVEEFKTQSTLTGVAQAVVDRISRMHLDFFMSSTTPRINKRDDMTLLLRNFNFPLPNSNLTPTNDGSRRFSSASSGSMNYTNSTATPTNFSVHSTPSPRVVHNPSPFTTQTNTEATTSTESSEAITQSNNPLPLDENGRIGAYVDFIDYYNVVASDPQKLEGLNF